MLRRFSDDAQMVLRECSEGSQVMPGGWQRMLRDVLRGCSECAQMMLIGSSEDAQSAQRMLRGVR